MTVPCRSCRWSSLHGARRDTTGNVVASRAVTWLHTKGNAGNEAAGRLADAGRRWLTVPEWVAVLLRTADSSSARVMFHRFGRQESAETVELTTCRAQCCFSCWPSCHVQAACRPR